MFDNTFYTMFKLILVFIIHSMPYRDATKKIWALANREDVKHYSRGDTVTTTDDLKYLWFVKSGFVKKFQILANGNISVQSFYTTGDSFPLTYVYQVLFDREIYHGPDVYYYEAMCPTVLARISGERLKQEIERDPNLYRDLLAIAGNRFTSDIQLLENCGLADAHTRVAHQLYHYAKRFGKKEGNATLILLPITQQDIADVLGLTRETVSTSINSLKHQGLLKKSRKLIVNDMSQLEDIAYG